MKIALFSSDNNVQSGAFRAEISLIADLKKKGHEVYLILPCLGSGTKVAKESKIKHKIILSIGWVCFYPKTIIDILFYIITRPINAIAAIKTRAFLRKNCFDLVSINTAWNGVGGEVAQKLGIPVVWHLREMLERGQNHRFFSRKKSYKILNNSNLLLPVTKVVYRYYENKINRDKMKVIYDGVKINSFHYPQKKLFTDKTIHILMIGRVMKQKGQHIGIKALNDLSKYNFDVTIVGYISAHNKRKLLKLGNKIKKRIAFVGVSKDVKEFYRNSDLFLMNSIGEAFGLVTVEAMLSGLPVIAAKCDGTSEIISDEKYGYYYKPSDYLDLKNKIEYVFNHKKEASKKARAGQTHAYKNFSSKSNSNLIEQAYLSVINKSNG